MSQDDRDPALETLFAGAEEHLDAETFTTTVMSRTATLRRRKILRRVCLMALLALVGIPLQDYGLALSQAFVVQVFPIDDALLAQLLAPVNTVGALFSAMVLGLRILHRRLFV